ncbi:hypothetical protein GCM10009785_13680 [Brooklawnia cerclae]|uniref:Antitoxin n=1 Tax=Brooklawnia cerclae TaxID=349934 RepID=A0ABX0SJB7_9ACTN|nr:hypothetical protein [Brooklawnia cerclae]NIH58505.1 hypothetical protein [Brooklawnia cerclae]
MSDYYVPTDDEIRASATRLGAWSGDTYDRWLANHDTALREEIAMRITGEAIHVTMNDDWSVGYRDAIAEAATIARGEPPTT